MSKICRLCLSNIYTPDCISIQAENPDSISIREKLLKCVPELDINLINEPLMCILCDVRLSYAYDFKSTCLKSQERITDYIGTTNTTENIDLLQVVNQNVTDQFTVSDELCNDSDILKLIKELSENVSDPDNDSTLSTTDAEDPYRININSVIAAATNSAPNGILKQLLTKPRSSIHTESITPSIINGVQLKECQVLLTRCDEKKVKVNSVNKNNLELEYQKAGGNHYKCSNCQKKFPNAKALEDHVQLFIMNNQLVCSKPFACKLCNYTSLYKRNLNQHLKMHTLLTPFTCRFCNLGFQEKQSLIEHMRSHVGQKCFSCKLCAFKCTLKDNMTEHIRTHLKQKLFICEYCGNQYSCQQQLTVHLQTHLSNKPLECDVCYYKTYKESDLQSHANIHNVYAGPEKIFKCELCIYSTTKQYNLKMHSMKHMKAEDKFICRFCNYRTFIKELFDRHIVTHTKETIFQCKQCNYKGISKYDMRRHRMWVHPNLSREQMDMSAIRNTFFCNYCSYRTKRRHDLKRHLIVHSEQNCICQICQEQFMSKFELGEHMKAVHRREIFTCDMCDYSALTEFEIRCHSEIHAVETEQFL